ncbi:hypothetical protein CXB51_009279 [Gossypium anomalum]|uniref:Aminotransferase-like plant mobile domain-containing protein n=1 Tax=Gossypium anomalum TaxID=47600 RepID=A0A8J5YTD9_9ROSI|nr:hypothetical protein CXB51_009279 [Gossypium anomalum]
MDSLIDSTNHISSSINEMVEYPALKGRIHSVGFQPDECPIPFLELAGFGSVALIQTFNLRYDLISALVERWRPETHTFHLPCGECTITLEDVTLQLGLPINGNAVTGVSLISRPARLCYDLLGRSPSEGKFQTLKFSWLKANFEYFPSTATELEVMQAARAYIMHLIGGVLMPDTHGSEVHLMYLPLLCNLHNTRSYSWGFAMLAILYRELCRTTDPSAVDIGGCLILLQSWALYRMPFLASISHQSYIFPLINRWSTNPGIGRSYMVPIYRLMIENHSGEGFIWMPYSVLEVTAVIPSYAHVHSHLWCISAPLIYFHTVEWYHDDRVLRQFSCRQYIPTQPVRLDVQLHGMNRRGRHGTNWGDEHSEYITMWNNRFSRAVDSSPPSYDTDWATSSRSAEPEPDQSRSYTSGAAHIHHRTLLLQSRIRRHSLLPPAHIQRRSLLPGSSSSVAFESFSTPIHMDEENVDHRSRPQCERRAPRRYTPRTTPSNHQF